MQHHQAPLLDKSDNTHATEHFLVYGYKVVPCSKRYRHDWSVCPFAHTGEMAARRDPSRYIPIFCFHSKQRLPCPRGDDCPYSHNLFEYWLHPKRYRTEMCQFGAACTRPVCFFAHGEHQLRHTDMPGGPQPVVAPPEPVPALNGGFGGRDLSSPIDPAVKQQQQLMALQAAAAGFSHQQQQQQAVAGLAAAGSMPGGLDGMGGAGLQHVSSYPGLVDTNSGLGGGMNGMGNGMGPAGMGMGMGSLQNPMGLASSSPLSAPLPQLSPDMLAALQSMGNGPAGGVSPMGNHLMHQHSGIPATHYGDHSHNRLQRSMTAHPAVNAAAAAAAANDNSTNLNELSKQLAFMQLMQGGRADTSGPLGDLNDQSMEQLLGLAQLQQHQAAAAAAAAVTAGLDLGRLLPVASSGYGHTTDGSLSCPLPPVFGGGVLGQGGAVGMHTLSNVTTASCTLPRVPTAPGASVLPHSPQGSDGGRDAPSPMGAGGRDTQVPAPSKKAARWSAPVSPSSSTRGGNVLAAADDVKLNGQAGAQHLSSSASSVSSAGGGEGRLHSIPSDHLARGLSDSLRELQRHDSISFSAGMGVHGLGHAAGAAGVGSSADAGSALLMIGDSPLAAAQVHAALSGGLDASVLGQQQSHGMGKEKAAQLLAQMPEDAVQKLLALMQQGGQ